MSPETLVAPHGLPTDEDLRDKLAEARKAEDKPARWDIPMAHRALIAGLAEESAKAKLRLDCNRSRFKAAVAAGNTDLALAEREDGKQLALAATAAGNALWDAIYESNPDIPTKAEDLRFDAEEFFVDRGRCNPLASLAAALGSKD